MRNVEILTLALSFLALNTWYHTLIFEVMFVMQLYFYYLFLNSLYRAVEVNGIYLILSKNWGNEKTF